MTMETWKDIGGYEGLYQVSSHGRIKILGQGGTHKKESIKNLCVKKRYISVTLYKNGQPKTFLVHRLVALAFLPNPNNLTEINHINEDKHDNRVENLEWCDRTYNNNYSDINHRRMCKTGYKIQQLSMSNEVVAEYHSTNEAEKKTGIFAKNIQHVLKEKRHSAGGFKWRFV